MRVVDGKPIDDIAIERLREFEQAAIDRDAGGYYVAFSGGKDSTVVYDLVKRAGVRATFHFHITCVDPPELVRFVRTFADVEMEHPIENMWQMIRRKRLPPTRHIRYCCDMLKEHRGAGCTVVTGVRWAESSRRAKRKMVEACYQDKSKWYLHPIIDWGDGDVWAYIRTRGLRYCSLYDEGFERVGCVLCPMNTQTQRHLERWPKIAALWERAIKATWRLSSGFNSPDDLWAWWLDRNTSRKKYLDRFQGQEVTWR